MMEGRWDRKKFKGTEVRGKTLGVVGVGRIGGEVAKRAQAFEMKVVAYDPLLTKLKAEALGVELVELDDLYARADFISVHAPKTDKTMNMINADALQEDEADRAHRERRPRRYRERAGFGRKP